MGERNEEEEKRIQKTTIHSSRNFTRLLERKGWRGPQGRYIAGLSRWQGGPGVATGIVGALALHRVRKRCRSSRVPLIACAGAPQGAGREEAVGCSLSNVGQRLMAVREWTRARVVLPGAGGARCHWLRGAGALRVGPQWCTAAE